MLATIKLVLWLCLVLAQMYHSYVQADLKSKAYKHTSMKLSIFSMCLRENEKKICILFLKSCFKAKMYRLLDTKNIWWNDIWRFALQTSSQKLNIKLVFILKRPIKSLGSSNLHITSISFPEKKIKYQD